MQYAIVKQEKSYVIVIDGQSVMKLQSRRKAEELVAAASAPRDEPARKDIGMVPAA